jgi:hypothetical protein
VTTLHKPHKHALKPPALPKTKGAIRKAKPVRQGQSAAKMKTLKKKEGLLQQGLFSYTEQHHYKTQPFRLQNNARSRLEKSNSTKKGHSDALTSRLKKGGENPITGLVLHTNIPSLHQKARVQIQTLKKKSQKANTHANTESSTKKPHNTPRNVLQKNTTADTMQVNAFPLDNIRAEMRETAAQYREAKTGPQAARASSNESREAAESPRSIP